MNGKDRKIELIPDEDTGMWFWCIIEYANGSGCESGCNVGCGSESSMDSAYTAAKTEWERLMVKD